MNYTEKLNDISKGLNLHFFKRALKEWLLMQENELKNKFTILDSGGNEASFTGLCGYVSYYLGEEVRDWFEDFLKGEFSDYFEENGWYFKGGIATRVKFLTELITILTVEEAEIEANKEIERRPNPKPKMKIYKGTEHGHHKTIKCTYDPINSKNTMSFEITKGFDRWYLRFEAERVDNKLTTLRVNGGLLSGEALSMFKMWLEGDL